MGLPRVNLTPRLFREMNKEGQHHITASSIDAAAVGRVQRSTERSNEGGERRPRRPLPCHPHQTSTQR